MRESDLRVARLRPNESQSRKVLQEARDQVRWRPIHQLFGQSYFLAALPRGADSARTLAGSRTPTRLQTTASAVWARASSGQGEYHHRVSARGTKHNSPKMVLS